MLEYNGIATLDGYLGFYPQQYKEDFRQIIAPAIERMEPSRIYYDDWGARAYLYSGTEASAVSTLKSFAAADQELYIMAKFPTVQPQYLEDIPKLIQIKITRQITVHSHKVIGENQPE
ncbi:hypothetical protein IMSAG025_00604 [Muribaculaceae bacterium]|nr:hypothetical protein IMSAG025_00604 [Muribaculaceae bacterium]